MFVHAKNIQTFLNIHMSCYKTREVCVRVYQRTHPQIHMHTIFYKCYTASINIQEHSPELLQDGRGWSARPRARPLPLPILPTPARWDVVYTRIQDRQHEHVCIAQHIHTHNQPYLLHRLHQGLQHTHNQPHLLHCLHQGFQHSALWIFHTVAPSPRRDLHHVALLSSNGFVGIVIKQQHPAGNSVCLCVCVSVCVCACMCVRVVVCLVSRCVFTVLARAVYILTSLLSGNRFAGITTKITQLYMFLLVFVSACVCVCSCVCCYASAQHETEAYLSSLPNHLPKGFTVSHSLPPFCKQK